MPNFIDIDLISSIELKKLIDDAIVRKKNRAGFSRGQLDKDNPLSSHILALLFEIPSTRTRISFDVAIQQLGGGSLILNSSEMQLGRGESVADTSRILSKFVDVIMLRCLKHESLIEMAEFASVPVINGLTNRSHPCQVLADLMTFIELKGEVKNKNFVWYGDYNNVTQSWVHASSKFNFNFIISAPKDINIDHESIDKSNANGGNVLVVEDPDEAALGADCVITDVWMSMGDNSNSTSLDLKNQKKIESLVPYKVTENLMKMTNKAIFMHCLPAYRDKEVARSVIDGKDSVVWQEAENRLHIQKSILLWCLNK
ncbi:MAG: Ornithine carbamoyltransferase [Alphaproteobacteria bacterium MarineAlpha2_Bin1]|nr:MAG: Ornithine carbamoyltransferase [Alphaproteobacteria bacterium MarineAlpha2_Bin1]